MTVTQFRTLLVLPVLALAAAVLTAQAPRETQAPYRQTVVEGTTQLRIVHRDGPTAASLVGAVSGAVEFYTQLFGRLPGDSLLVVEHQAMPFYVPGAVFLPEVTTGKGAPADTALSVDALTTISMTLARCWWDGVVTFDDSAAVIQEGLIRYSALLYVFQRTDNASLLFADLQQAADVLTAEEIPDETAFASAHGLWLMHMLRNLMIDQNTLADEAYQTTVRSLYHRFRGRTASIGDLRADTETVLGIDMGWFFEEWIPLTAIPIYEWAWESVPDFDGRYSNTIRVQQSNVPEGFQMYIPIQVILEDGTSTRYRIKMVGSEALMDLPQSDQPIARIVFNEFASVLCAAKEGSF